jgi:hypothetical protein
MSVDAAADVRTIAVTISWGCVISSGGFGLVPFRDGVDRATTRAVRVHLS